MATENPSKNVNSEKSKRFNWTILLLLLAGFLAAGYWKFFHGPTGETTLAGQPSPMNPPATDNTVVAAELGRDRGPKVDAGGDENTSATAGPVSDIRDALRDAPGGGKSGKNGGDRGNPGDPSNIGGQIRTGLNALNPSNGSNTVSQSHP